MDCGISRIFHYYLRIGLWDSPELWKCHGYYLLRVSWSLRMSLILFTITYEFDSETLLDYENVLDIINLDSFRLWDWYWFYPLFPKNSILRLSWADRISRILSTESLLDTDTFTEMIIYHFIIRLRESPGLCKCHWYYPSRVSWTVRLSLLLFTIT